MGGVEREGAVSRTIFRDWGGGGLLSGRSGTGDESRG